MNLQTVVSSLPERGVDPPNDRKFRVFDSVVFRLFFLSSPHIPGNHVGGRWQPANVDAPNYFSQGRILEADYTSRRVRYHRYPGSGALRGTWPFSILTSPSAVRATPSRLRRPVTRPQSPGWVDEARGTLAVSRGQPPGRDPPGYGPTEKTTAQRWHPRHAAAAVTRPSDLAAQYRPPGNPLGP